MHFIYEPVQYKCSNNHQGIPSAIQAATGQNVFVVVWELWNYCELGLQKLFKWFKLSYSLSDYI